MITIISECQNRYLGMTKKLHKSIAKLNYELNNSEKGVRGSKITHIND